jgi:hypothetical protein
VYITINVPVVSMAWDVMILVCGLIHIEGHWKGWALKIETLLGPPLPLALEMDLPAWGAGGSG